MYLVFKELKAQIGFMIKEKLPFSWIDFVLYKGNTVNFNLLEIQKFIAAFTLSINEEAAQQKAALPNYRYKNNLLKTTLESL